MGKLAKQLLVVVIISAVVGTLIKFMFSDTATQSNTTTDSKSNYQSEQIEIDDDIKNNVYSSCDDDATTSTCIEAVKLCLNNPGCTKMVREYALKKDIINPTAGTVIEAAKDWVNIVRNGLGLPPVN